MSCNVTRLTRPFRVVGVPLDSKFLFEGEYGAAGIPAEHFDAATFGGKFEDGGKISIYHNIKFCNLATFKKIWYF
jgi:hypothetical protein